jgi:hypothetical protein
MKNVNWNRAMKDRKDYKRYEGAFLGFLVALILFGVGYSLLGMLMAVLG